MQDLFFSDYVKGGRNTIKKGKWQKAKIVFRKQSF